MAYTAIDDPTLYFNTSAVWSGDDSEHIISGIGHQPDFTWIKGVNIATQHYIFDSVRGATKYIIANGTNAEATNAQTLKSWNSDGFVLGTSDDVNGSSRTYVAWNWKAGTTLNNSADTNGGSIATTGSINTTSGFGIVQYEGSGANATIYHGLTKIPRLIITKNIDQAFHWSVYNFSSNTTILRLNDTNAPATETAFQSTDPTATVQSLGDHNQNNGATDGSSDTHISYMFCDVQGFSKIGSYTGNGSADGIYIHLGFRPAWFMTKRTDSATAGNWRIRDIKREPGQPLNAPLSADSNNAENDGDNDWDIVSNGLKLRDTGIGENASGGTYIYMAFAEAPFVNSNGVPCNAR
jgi:hypothetical protein